MDDEAQVERSAPPSFCPECGCAEDGFFCRQCGALLRGGDMFLCPRCHQVVPGGEYCNRCGQSLRGLAVQLRQLALAGDVFWVTSEAAARPAAPEEMVLGSPDESVVLEAPELPDWLQELPPASAPGEAGPHIYPALKPIPNPKEGSRQRRFLVLVILLLGLMLLNLVFLALYVVLHGGA